MDGKNIYMKLQNARAALAALKLKPTGKNPHMGYSYMTLGDFLPHVSRICAEEGICAIFNMGKEKATLVIADGGEEEITFSMPTGEARLAGNASPVQCLGAARTYMMRYLYSNAFEIKEDDALENQYDGNAKRRETVKKQAPKGRNEREEKRLVMAEVMKERDRKGMSNEQMSALVAQNFNGKKGSELTLDEAVCLLTILQDEK